MKRRVMIVDGPLALGMRRFWAAKANEVGTDILTLPLLAARLAGGFSRAADREVLSTVVAAALRADSLFGLDPGLRRGTRSNQWHA